MTATVKAADAAQFLSLVPHLLGFRPTRSVVLVPFAGSRSLGAMRVDLPQADDPGDGDSDAVASTLLGMVCRLREADGVAAIVYCDESLAERMPHEPLAAALARSADTCGLHVNDLLCVGDDGWGSYLDETPPPGGRPLPEIEQGLAGLEPLGDGDQTSGAELPEASADERAAVARALETLEQSVAVVCGPEAAPVRPRARGRGADAPDAAASGRIDPQGLAEVCALDDLPTLFERALAWNPDALRSWDAAVLAWCLARPSLRDIALVEWCAGLRAGDEAFDAQLRWEAGEEYPAHLAMRMWGEGERPDPDRLGRALDLARRIAAVAPEPQRPGALATCGWLAWALGRSTHAQRYATAACELEPEHGLAEIVRSFVAAGHLPDWAFQAPQR